MENFVSRNQEYQEYGPERGRERETEPWDHIYGIDQFKIDDTTTGI